VQTQERMYKVEDVQRRLGVGRATAYKLVSTGEIPSYRVGRVLRIKPEDVDGFLDKNRRESVR
jgi:putative molybdopterin biosynthesis protein